MDGTNGWFGWDNDLGEVVEGDGGVSTQSVIWKYNSYVYTE